MDDRTKKSVLIVSIMVPIALLHFVTGSQYNGPFAWFVNGYLLDILLPMGFYLLLCLSSSATLSSWLAKAATVFGTAFFVEMAQRKGIPLFGSTFDPWDILMYAIGVALAVMLDTVLFPHVLRFWNPDRQRDSFDQQSNETPFTWRYK